MGLITSRHLAMIGLEVNEELAERAPETTGSGATVACADLAITSKHSSRLRFPATAAHLAMAALKSGSCASAADAATNASAATIGACNEMFIIYDFDLKMRPRRGSGQFQIGTHSVHSTEH
jgi:hypothetical protein